VDCCAGSRWIQRLEGSRFGMFALWVLNCAKRGEIWKSLRDECTGRDSEARAGRRRTGVLRKPPIWTGTADAARRRRPADSAARPVFRGTGVCVPEVLPGIPADDLIHLLRKRRAFDGSRKPPRIGNLELARKLGHLHSVLIMRFALGRVGVDMISAQVERRKKNPRVLTHCRIDSIAASSSRRGSRRSSLVNASAFANSRFAYENCPSTPSRGF